MTRLARTLRMLTAGHPLSTTSTDCGFYDQAHLTRHFKRIVGLTPGRYATQARRIR